MECKACGSWFSTTADDELCPTCERAMNRLKLDLPYSRLRELVESDREGRIKIHPKAENNTCGACGHFLRIAGRRCGTCDVQSQYRDRYGRADDRRGTFTPSQSRKACKRFEHREE